MNLTNEMTKALEDSIVQAKRPPSMTGDNLQKFGYHLQGIENDLEGAKALMEAFPLIPEKAQRYILVLMQRGMR